MMKGRPAAMDRPLVILSDLHLGRQVDLRQERDFAALVAQHVGYEVVLAGDVFDLSLEPPRHDVRDSLSAMLGKHETVRAALRSHVASGGRLTLVPGNHDAELLEPPARPALLGALDLQDSAPLSVAPWFVRRGGVHIEHGHLYDPDNATLHPMVALAEAEPLGIALTRRFVGPSGATHFLHAHDTTPLEGFLDAWRLYGLRTPRVIYRYFATAGRLCMEAGNGRRAQAEHARQVGEGRLHAMAEEEGLDAELLRSLVDGLPEPRHLKSSRLFMRLYFDRVIATVAATAGTAVAGSLFGGRAAARLWALSTSYLALSVLTGGNRYGESAVEALRAGALRIATLTEADVVIFGHVHVPDSGPRYLNSGSFAFPTGEGRPYIVVSEQGAERRFTPASA